jgi:transcription antitermination factor NusG
VRGIVPAFCAEEIRAQSPKAYPERKGEANAWLGTRCMCTAAERMRCAGVREWLEQKGYNEPYKMFVVKRELLERRQGECYTISKILFPGYVLVESEDIRSFAELARNCNSVRGRSRKAGAERL